MSRSDLRAVALGGGHGLAASLRALRRITPRITAVVTVADDGGSSGRLRKEFNVLPPGDLRMALAALCDEAQWGHTWAKVVQHRFGGDGDLRGHSVGNLLIAALWEETNDIVAGLDWLGALLRIEGRVLPCSTVPLDVVATIEHVDGSTETVRGQVAVATSKGRVSSLWLEPQQPPACPQALDAIRDAQVLVLGPGSWYTSVLTHLAIDEIRTAFMESTATKILVLNVEPGSDETGGFAAHSLIDVLQDNAPGLTFDAVISDVGSSQDLASLTESAARMGAAVYVDPVSHGPGSGVHDPEALARSLAGVLATHGRIAPWP